MAISFLSLLLVQNLDGMVGEGEGVHVLKFFVINIFLNFSFYLSNDLMYFARYSIAVFSVVEFPAVLGANFAGEFYI